ncbi:hypothetical protein ABH926_008443 [Catenulispora sp. GP43]|uniref:golvesin C-terminal-like domain-containing protein n=1 Tax=Catenulispora sp. GP43 TaxID=3156263 RepID=UPI003511FCE2
MLSAATAVAIAGATLTVGAGAVPSAQAAAQPAALAPASSTTSRVADPDHTLPGTWRTSTDRAVTAVGTADGLNVLVADSAAAYQWRTAATLSEPGFDSAQWIGQDCVTGSGNYAAVVYAPRELTNHGDVGDAGAFVAIVDLRSGAVRKLDLHASLAYYDPGCGTGDTFVVSDLQTTSAGATTHLELVDAATGAIVERQAQPGQLTSAVPLGISTSTSTSAGTSSGSGGTGTSGTGTGIAAVAGDQVVALDAKGARHTLSTEAGVPLRLYPDAGGGLAYEVPVSSSDYQIKRWSGGSPTVLGHGAPSRLRLDGTAGHVFVLGPDAAAVATERAGAGWSRLADAGVEAEPSTTGQLVVTGSASRTATQPGLSSAAGRAPDGQIEIQSVVSANSHVVSFTVAPHALQPSQGSAPSPILSAIGGAAKPAATKAAVTNVSAATNPATETVDPDRACSVARNDPTIETYQATAAQVEWAADLAVQGRLTQSRPPNWEGSGMKVSWTPQGMFPLQKLSGGGTVPVQVLLGVLAQESNTLQASPHAVDAVDGNFNQGGFYGYSFTDSSGTTQPAGSSWTSADCGYGVGQVTTGMAMSTPAGTPVADGDIAGYTTAEQQQAIATDYASNIAASLNMLIDSWNQLKAAGILANTADPQYVENWYLAVWAYNTGVEPDAKHGDTTGCTPSPTCTDGQGDWGLGWFNNPANPRYPSDRGIFSNSAADTKVPNHWPYQELVMGWAYSPVPRYDYAKGVWGPAYLAAYNAHSVAPLYAPSMEFCSTAGDKCTPDAAADVNGKANTAGLCQAPNGYCWWHSAATWAQNCAQQCGTAQYEYGTSSAVPTGTDIYPPDCSTSALPSNAVIVDDTTVASPVGQCTQTWKDQGSFGVDFTYLPVPGCVSPCVDYPGKIDFHQVGVGFGGHLWFTHTGDTTEVTGTWTPPSTTTGWTRIKVHVPSNGGNTEEADYQINLGNGQTRHRIISQHWNQNTWVDLGSFDLSAGASVSLSNSSPTLQAQGVNQDGGDISFDAVAFIPTVASTVRYVAMGDSYTSGESISPYEADSAQDGDGCHRSPQAYPYQVVMPGQSKSIEATAAANGGDDFAFIACSGAETTAVTQQAVGNPDNWNADWNSSYFQWGEPLQIDDNGFLDQDTTLVTLSIGGNDARFSDVVEGCTLSTTNDCVSPTYYLTHDGTVDPQPLTTYEPKIISALQSHLQEVYTAVHQAAPKARIVVVGYPHLFPANSRGCQNISPAATAWLNQMSDALATSVSTAVTATKQANAGLNISFMDVRSTFASNEVCSPTPWINGIVAGYLASSFHPMAPGHAAEAAQLNALLK